MTGATRDRRDHDGLVGVEGADRVPKQLVKNLGYAS